MQSARRYDSSKLPGPGAGAHRDARGFLAAPARVTRTGVLTYRRADGTTVRELRHPDDVFRADSLETLRLAPLTVGHPKDAAGEPVNVDATNAREFDVGHVDQPRRDGEFVAGTAIVRPADVVARIDSRELQELSCGYDCKIDPTPGTYQGERYDQRQVEIRYNHVALLPVGKGRAGRDVKLRLDSDAELVEEEITRVDQAPAPNGQELSMRKIRIDGVDYELADPAAQVVERMQAQLAETQTKLTQATTRADQAEAERDVLRTDLTRATDPKVVREAVQARVSLERSAVKVLGETERLDALSDREIREKVIKVNSPDFKCEGRSDEGIAAAFDLCIAKPAGNRGLALVAGAIDAGAAAVDQPRTDAADPAPTMTLDQARAKRLNGARPKAEGK